MALPLQLMSNTYFQFKQFTIHQKHCAMKVCTDACLFGAWVAEGVDRWKMTVGSVLDIGTGTGLLSLMLAQKSTGIIDAVELDEKAAGQAAENFEASPWNNRCQVIQADIRTVHLGRKYDLIISNPPFFEHDLKSTDALRNLALHSKELSLAELLSAIKKYLADNGNFAVLLPFHRKTEFEKLAVAEGFSLQEAVSVKQTSTHDFFRVILLFSSSVTTVINSNISIRENDQYSEDFIGILKDFYLRL
jgi:tRNA1Val (adenine37-N6)-methyltransferase